MNSLWNDLLRDYFKVDLDTDEIARWYEELNEELHTSPTELKGAIHFAGTHKEKNRFDGKPTLQDLMIWVKWYRKNRREERDGTFSASTQEGFIAMLKSKMLNAASHMDRWNILCQPKHYCNAQRDTTYDECCLLEEWLEQKYKDWRRPTMQELEEQYKREHGIEKPKPGVVDDSNDLPF